MCEISFQNTAFNWVKFTCVQYLLKDLLEKCDTTTKGKVIETAAAYEHRSHRGSKTIFHLEAFVANFMSLYARFLEECGIANFWFVSNFFRNGIMCVYKWWVIPDSESTLQNVVKWIYNCARHRFKSDPLKLKLFITCHFSIWFYFTVIVSLLVNWNKSCGNFFSLFFYLESNLSGAAEITSAHEFE